MFSFDTTILTFLAATFFAVFFATLVLSFFKNPKFKFNIGRSSALFFGFASFGAALFAAKSFAPSNFAFLSLVFAAALFSTLFIEAFTNRETQK